MFGEGVFRLLGDGRRVKDSLEGGFGGVVVFDGFGADSFFVEEFDGGAEEVEEEPPFLGVEVV